jgi:hypothetical protein
MSGFIEIVDKKKCRRLINVRHIEEVAENITKDGCYIYLAFNTPNAIEQDYFEVAESYDAITEKITESVVLNAYAQVQGV